MKQENIAEFLNLRSQFGTSNSGLVKAFSVHFGEGCAFVSNIFAGSACLNIYD
jgi:hypothetical protein